MANPNFLDSDTDGSSLDLGHSPTAKQSYKTQCTSPCSLTLNLIFESKKIKNQIKVQKKSIFACSHVWSRLASFCWQNSEKTPVLTTVSSHQKPRPSFISRGRGWRKQLSPPLSIFKSFASLCLPWVTFLSQTGAVLLANINARRTCAKINVNMGAFGASFVRESGKKFLWNLKRGRNQIDLSRLEIVAHKRHGS